MKMTNSDETFNICNETNNATAELIKYFHTRCGSCSGAKNSETTSPDIAVNATFFCNVSGESVPLSVVDDLIPDCGLEAEDEHQLMALLVAENSDEQIQNYREKLNFYSEKEQLPCRKGHFRCFLPHDICVFQLVTLSPAEMVHTWWNVACCIAMPCSSVLIPTVYHGHMFAMADGTALLERMSLCCVQKSPVCWHVQLF